MKDKQYIFSIIMPIYNVEKWLEEAILSIIKQKKINFERDIQLILVNDCSPDNSEEICLKFKNKYPNIIYHKNSKNLGLSETRNAGLKFAQGKLINFFDPDDILSPSTLFEVNKFFDENKLENLAHISIPLVFFEAASGLHPKYKLLGNKNKIIKLDKERHNFILSSASSFYKRELIIDKTFDSTLFGEEDTLFNFRLYEKNYKFGYVCENQVQYNYRKRNEGGSQVDLSRIKPQSFLTPIQLLEKVNIDKNDELFYELIIYQLRSRVKNIRPEIFESFSEYHRIIERYRYFMSLIPKDFILYKTKFLETPEQKIDFLTEIYKNSLHIDKDAYILVKDNKLFKCNELPIDVKSIRLEKNTLIIETLFNNFNIKELSVVIMDKSKNIINPTIQYYCNSSYIHKCCGIPSSNEILYSKFEIPVFKIGEYSLYFKRRSNNYLHIINRIRTYSESPFLGNGVFNTKLFKLYSEQNTTISLFKKRFIIEREHNFEKLVNKFKTLLLIKKKHHIWKWMRLAKIGKPKYWLFNDRPINANDNAEAFFEYVNKASPKLAKNAYFVLDRDSPDIARIKNIGKVVIQNSLKHKFLYLNAKYIFTSHLATSFFKPISFRFLKYYNDLIESKIIWLQHGVTMNDIESAANKFNKQIYKVVTAASFENEIFNQKNFFLSKEDIYLTGFPRYDKLKKMSDRKEILIMPTWRSFLSGKILPNGLHDELPDFITSEYYKNFSDLISDPYLLDVLEKNNIVVKFVLHPGFKQYAKLFSKFNFKNIEVIDEISISYKNLFNSASLLITDYSSVFFDFSYTRKPCLFFQFDKDEFFSKHYKEGIFNFETMAPGKVINNTKSLILEIVKYINTNFSIEQEYLDRIDNIYAYKDNRNNERLLNKVLKDD